MDYLAAAETRLNKQTPKQPFQVLGVNTRQSASGSLYQDFLPQLQGLQGMRTIREMTHNDATIGSILYAVEMLLREMPWSAEPDETDPGGEEAAEFLGECVEDMEHTWPDHVARALSFLPYGFSMFETIYRRRRHTDGSMFDDGRIGWRRFDPRPQESIDKWVWDDGRLTGVRQATGRGSVFIPIEKLLHYTTDSTTPEGRSILRTAYTSWYYKKYATEQTMIGLQRDLAGMPVAWIPAENLLAKDSVYETWRNIVTRSKKDELWGWLLPLERDGQGNKVYEFEIVRGGGGNLRDAMALIRMFAMDIATTVLAEFVGLGRDTVGSRALAEPKQELFQTTLEAWADAMAATLNHQAVRPLLRLNGLSGASLVHGPVKDTNLADLAQLIRDTGSAGVDWSDEASVNRIRALGGFPAVEGGMLDAG